MTSKTCCTKGSIIKYNLKRYWWISALSFVFLFLATILRILVSNYDIMLDVISRNPESFGRLITRDVSIYILIPSVSVFIAVCVLRYMQSPQSATLLHSMPIKRTELFLSTFLSGLILYALPIISTGIILVLMSTVTKFQYLFSLEMVLRWCGVFLLYGAAFYSVSIFVGVFTGSSIAQFIFTYIVLALPLGVYVISTFLLEGWLFAFTASGAESTAQFLLNISPLHYPIAITKSLGMPLYAWQPLLMGIYIALLFFAALIFYKKRNIENSGDVIAFKFVRPIFLYGVTFCTSLVGAGLVKAISNDKGVSLIALILWALVGYAVAKMLMLKSFRIFKYYKGILVAACIILIFWLGIEYNVFGYGKKAPETEDISQAFLGANYYEDWHKDNLRESNYMYWSSATFSSKENIDAVISLNKKALSEASSDTDKLSVYYFSYKLKNGRVIVRKYSLPAEEVNNIFSTPEAKDYMFAIIRKSPEKIRYIHINSKNAIYNVDVPSSEQKSLLEALSRDIDMLSYDKLYNQSENKGIYNLEFTLITDNKNQNIDPYYYVNVNSSFTNTTKWIEENSKSSWAARSTDKVPAEIAQ